MEKLLKNWSLDQQTKKSKRIHTKPMKKIALLMKKQPAYQNETLELEPLSELETQQSREISSKKIFQQTDKENEDSDSQIVIGSDENVNPQQKKMINEKDHPINQYVNNLKHETQQSPKTINKEPLQSTDKESKDLVETNE